ncbi:MAG: hypothetical protein NC044_01810, partial [Prevotella sp.]|nr:hypothetical protein [Bacteroides sp.]MCM1445129.1 hypothetical protein [Prevotella sp.]
GYSLTFPMLSFTYIQTDNVYGGSTGIHIRLAGDAQRLIADDVYGEVLVYGYNAWYDNNYKFTVDIIYQINSVTGGVTANFLMYVTQFKSFTQWKYPVFV